MLLFSTLLSRKANYQYEPWAVNGEETKDGDNPNTTEDNPHRDPPSSEGRTNAFEEELVLDEEIDEYEQRRRILEFLVADPIVCPLEAARICIDNGLRLRKRNLQSELDRCGDPCTDVPQIEIRRLQGEFFLHVCRLLSRDMSSTEADALEEVLFGVLDSDNRVTLDRGSATDNINSKAVAVTSQRNSDEHFCATSVRPPSLSVPRDITVSVKALQFIKSDDPRSDDVLISELEETLLEVLLQSAPQVVSQLSEKSASATSTASPYFYFREVTEIWVRSSLEVTLPPRPTTSPTVRPTLKPTRRPTDKPTLRPTENPSLRPTPKPTLRPTIEPSSRPTEKPTKKPTLRPTEKPTLPPTDRTTFIPTPAPTVSPTNQPTSKPESKPTMHPTGKPTLRPSLEPISHPTKEPTLRPTAPKLPFLPPTPNPTTLDPTTLPQPTAQPQTESPTTDSPTIATIPSSNRTATSRPTASTPVTKSPTQTTDRPTTSAQPLATKPPAPPTATANPTVEVSTESLLESPSPTASPTSSSASTGGTVEPTGSNNAAPSRPSTPAPANEPPSASPSASLPPPSTQSSAPSSAPSSMPRPDTKGPVRVDPEKHNEETADPTRAPAPDGSRQPSISAMLPSPDDPDTVFDSSSPEGQQNTIVAIVTTVLASILIVVITVVLIMKHKGYKVTRDPAMASPVQLNDDDIPPIYKSHLASTQKRIQEHERQRRAARRERRPNGARSQATCE